MKKKNNVFYELVNIMKKLRDKNGCPWDREQTRDSIKPYLIEEAYELLEAIDGKNPDKIKEELGDLLFQIIFHAKLAEEQKEFDVFDVC
ncbi:MAG: MazG nucleotide pyrophosphohydrolase domain-containing protein, partial [Nitrospinota bacterium]